MSKTPTQSWASLRGLTIWLGVEDMGDPRRRNRSCGPSFLSSLAALAIALSLAGDALARDGFNRPRFGAANRSAAAAQPHRPASVTQQHERRRAEHKAAILAARSRL